MIKKMFQTKAKLIKNVAVTQKYYKIILSCLQIAKVVKPGQFVNVKVSDDCQPLLRRPFSIHRVNGSNIEILFEVVGKGTEILSQKKVGGYLDIIGPLGNGFDYSLYAKRYTQPILIAGGMGVAPLLFLAEKIVTSQESQVTSKPIVLVGAKAKGQVLCEKEFKDLGCEVKIATDDGSRGFKGRITDLLKKTLPRATSHEPRAIYACGPRPMLKEIAVISKTYNTPAQVSLEEHMACGIGACLGCAVKTRYAIRDTRYEYKRVCKEGPVFKAEEIIW